MTVSTQSSGVEPLLSPQVFKALGDPTRMAILRWMVSSGVSELSVSEVSREFPLDLSVISRHLSQLRDAGILDAERRGRHVLYRVRDAWIASTFRRFAEVFEAPVAARPAMTTLKVRPRSARLRTIPEPVVLRSDEGWRSW